MTALIAILVFAAIIILVIIVLYNGLIRKKNEVENAFGGMDAQLKKRYDLIPNLVETVKQYAKHEKDLLENVTELRANVRRISRLLVPGFIVQLALTKTCLNREF